MIHISKATAVKESFLNLYHQNREIFDRCAMKESSTLVAPIGNTMAEVKCKHCGDICAGDYPVADDKSFCCQGCLVIYQVLDANGLGAYYQLNDVPGISQRSSQRKSFEYLDDPDVIGKLLDFRNGDIARIRFHLPQIHCSSCIWLLENIHQLHTGIMHSRVNFLDKKASITFRIDEITLKELVELLTKIGYEPKLSFNDLGQKDDRLHDRQLLYKIGLAGFSFGNIMLISFPEYLGFDKASMLFYLGYINLVLAIPVLFYSGRDYLISAWKSIVMRSPGIDVPVALGMTVLFGRSAYEILSGTGEGYLDSFSGFVFFLLIGKWFQSYTYQSLSFEHSYKSYFPISAHLLDGNNWISRSIDQLKKGDRIMVKNEEIVPCDGTLIKGDARIDYSFVTGESDPQKVALGEMVLAGGKQKGAAIEMIVAKAVDQSYLTQLWNEDIFYKEQQSTTSKFINAVSKHFTWIILLLAVLMFVYWWVVEPGLAFQVFTAVLIVACPCALALSVPFIYGNGIRLLADKSVYYKNTAALENLQDIDTIIFDKTGTITDLDKIQVDYQGKKLDAGTTKAIKSLAEQSGHPLSKAIAQHFSHMPAGPVTDYKEIPGSGIEGAHEGRTIRMGSASFIFGTDHHEDQQAVYVEIGKEYVGKFLFQNELRQDIDVIITSLSKRYTLGVLSGDNSREQERLASLFPAGSQLLFNQKPKDKLQYIQNLQNEGHKVMMIGDGLNDAGALKQSDIGMVISSENNNFNPSCDVIVSAAVFTELPRILTFGKQLKHLLLGALLIAFLYNSIGLYFAVTGKLSPVVAAILMPTSSLSVMLYGVLVSGLAWQMRNRTFY